MNNIDWIAVIFCTMLAFPVWLSGIILYFGWGKRIILNIPFLIGPCVLVALFLLYCYTRIA
jgi:hypothetical protein